MRHDRNGGKRTNWLLIKHRDEFAKDGDGDDILEEDHSVASGRSMEQIAAGKGKAPKPFMTAKSGRAKADAVWHSNRGEAAEARASKKAATKAASKPRPAAAKTKGKKVAAMPDFVAPQFCASVDRPPSGEGWCHEIKFDGYRMQLRVEDGKAVLKTRKGLDWTDKFAAIAKAGKRAARLLIDGEIVALDHDGAPDFAALQAALSDGKTDSLIFFAFDLLFAEARICAALPLAERKAQLKRMLAARKAKGKVADRSAMSSISRRRRCGAAIGPQLSLEGIVSKKLGSPYQLRPRRELDQGQMPRRP